MKKIAIIETVIKNRVSALLSAQHSLFSHRIIALVKRYTMAMLSKITSSGVRALLLTQNKL
jgi:hypothetical protein